MSDAVSKPGLFDRVVVAVDGADDSAPLLDILPSLVPLGAVQFTLVHVAAVATPVSGAVTPLEGAEAQVTESLATLRAKGLTAHGEVRTGAAAEEVVRVAGEREASLLVVGARRHGRMYDAVIGSVALHIVERSTVPVLVVPARSTAGEDRTTGATAEPSTETDGEANTVSGATGGSSLGEHLLLATDFSATSDRALELAEQLIAQRRGHVRVTLLHATEGGWELGQGDDSDEARFERDAKRLQDAGAAEVETILLDEDPVDAIARVAALRPDTLVLMGTRGRGFLGSLVLGSVSRHVASRIGVPLLLIPPSS